MGGQFDLGGVTVRRYFGVIAVVLGLLFALVDDRPQGLLATIFHFLQWQLQTIIPMALLVSVQILLLRVNLPNNVSPWWRLTLSSLIATLLHTPIALSIDILFGTDTELFNTASLIGEFLAMAPAVIICWLAINAPWVYGFQLTKESASAQTEQHTEQQTKHPTPAYANAPFYKRLPQEKQTELVYLQAELHYLAVVTTAGRSLILYNLRDAIQELPESVGVQTHRSYWVALNSISQLKRVSRQGEITVSNGDIIPVSRRHYNKVEIALSEKLA